MTKLYLIVIIKWNYNNNGQEKKAENENVLLLTYFITVSKNNKINIMVPKKKVSGLILLSYINHFFKKEKYTFTYWSFTVVNIYLFIYLLFITYEYLLICFCRCQ